MPRSDPIPASSLAPAGHASSGRWNCGAWLFRDRTLHGLEILLDEVFVLPGTGIRFGIDGIIGLVPGLGDVVAGLLSLIIPLAAWMRGVSYVTLARMAANLGIGVLVGSIPAAGRRPGLGLCRAGGADRMADSLADPALKSMAL